MTFNRRDWMMMAAATGTAVATVGANAAANTATAAANYAGVQKCVVLYCELAVDPKREKEMLDHFHKVFAPEAARHKGYIDLKMLKHIKHIQGVEMPKAINYRFQLTYETEELRLAWVASPEHVKVWPGIEATLLDKNFEVEVFDNV